MQELVTLKASLESNLAFVWVTDFQHGVSIKCFLSAGAPLPDADRRR